MSANDFMHIKIRQRDPPITCCYDNLALYEAHRAPVGKWTGGLRSHLNILLCSSPSSNRVVHPAKRPTPAPFRMLDNHLWWLRFPGHPQNAILFRLLLKQLACQVGRPSERWQCPAYLVNVEDNLTWSMWHYHPPGIEALLHAGALP